MDHSSVYKITFFLSLSSVFLSVLDPAWLNFEGVYTDINFFHIFYSQGTSKHKENEQTRKTIESSTWENTNIRNAHFWLHFYGRRFYSNMQWRLVGWYSSVWRERRFFFISFNSFLKIVFNFTFVVFFVPKWEIILLTLLFFGRFCGQGIEADSSSSKYNKNKPLL